jgi:hypothetical protein
VAAGEAVAVIDPDEGQVVESLRALYLVGQPQDLGDVERFATGAPTCRNGCASKQKPLPKPSANGRRKGKAEGVPKLNRELESEMRLDFFGGHHLDGVPRAAVQKAAIGPLLVHFLQPMQSAGSTSMRPNGGWSSSGTQYMQSATWAIRNAGRRAGATRAAFGDDRKFLRPLLARRFNANGFGLALDDFPAGM